MVHKPKHKVHSFRGLLADGGQDEINLERSNLNIAYRIIKFQIQLSQPGADALSWVAVWKEEQTSISSTTILVDFDNPDLLASGLIAWDESQVIESGTTLIFENTLFSRNIYITHTNSAAAAPCNYYIELEEVPVGAATLMQIKLGTARKLINAKMGA